MHGRLCRRAALHCRYASKQANKQDRLIALCRQRGLIHPGSEIYGGQANSYDYGFLGESPTPLISCSLRSYPLFSSHRFLFLADV